MPESWLACARPGKKKVCGPGARRRLAWRAVEGAKGYRHETHLPTRRTAVVRLAAGNRCARRPGQQRQLRELQWQLRQRRRRRGGARRDQPDRLDHHGRRDRGAEDSEHLPADRFRRQQLPRSDRLQQCRVPEGRLAGAERPDAGAELFVLDGARHPQRRLRQRRQQLHRADQRLGDGRRKRPDLHAQLEHRRQRLGRLRLRLRRQRLERDADDPRAHRCRPAANTSASTASRSTPAASLRCRSRPAMR